MTTPPEHRADTAPTRISDPVFVDASGRRAHKARRWALVLALPAAAYVVALGSSVLGGPSLPSALLPPAVPDAAAPAQDNGPRPSTAGSSDPTVDPAAADDAGTDSTERGADGADGGDGADDPAPGNGSDDTDDTTPSPTEQVTAPAPTTPAPTTAAPTTPAPTTPSATPTQGRPASPGNSDTAQDAHKPTEAPGKPKATPTP
ncbi:hypothetical protein [Mumia sp. DW29H23]|uniref:hypothetical protein n=1 Tax=Mumia sp. DW29H23 TaxID=3421241 RepID=UPI003D68A72A